MCSIFALCSIIHKESQFELVVVSINLNLSINTQHHQRQKIRPRQALLCHNGLSWFLVCFSCFFVQCHNGMPKSGSCHSSANMAVCFQAWCNYKSGCGWIQRSLICCNSVQLKKCIVLQWFKTASQLIPRMSMATKNVVKYHNNLKNTAKKAKVWREFVMTTILIHF